jgi:hypothetical protein
MTMMMSARVIQGIKDKIVHVTCGTKPKIDLCTAQHEHAPAVALAGGISCDMH